MDWKAWAQLVRLPNTFTSCADVLAGMCIVGGASHSFFVHPTAGFLVSLASIAMYWGGMVLNDVFDLRVDQEQGRPGPLVTGRINVNLALQVGIGLLLSGIVFSLLATASILYLGQYSLAALWIPLAIAVALALAIVAYDGPMKKTPVAPAIMGICRGLNMTLGMAIVGSALQIPLGPAAVAIVIGHATYIAGVTIAARREASLAQSRSRLIVGWSTSAIGAAIIAFAPRWEPERWFCLDHRIVFPALIVVLLIPLGRRAVHSIITLEPKRLGMAIKQSIISILFLDAALALQFAGEGPGVFLCILVIPTLILGRMFRST